MLDNLEIVQLVLAVVLGVIDLRLLSWLIDRHYRNGGGR